MDQLKLTSLWAEMSNDEKLNARDGVERYLLTHIYRITFSADETVDDELMKNMSLLQRYITWESIDQIEWNDEVELYPFLASLYFCFIVHSLWCSILMSHCVYFATYVCVIQKVRASWTIGVAHLRNMNTVKVCGNEA